MCRKTTCSSCKKATWAGCGSHISQVLRGVKDEDRCKCREKKMAPPSQPIQSTQPTTTQSAQPTQPNQSNQTNQTQNPFQNPALAPRPVARPTNKYNISQNGFFVPPTGSSGFPGRR